MFAQMKHKQLTTVTFIKSHKIETWPILFHSSSNINKDRIRTAHPPRYWTRYHVPPPVQASYCANYSSGVAWALKKSKSFQLVTKMENSDIFNTCFNKSQHFRTATNKQQGMFNSGPSLPTNFHIIWGKYSRKNVD